MKNYIAENWRAILAYNNLADFDSIWNLKADWFESPNHRRGGWSGVCHIHLKLPEGGNIGVFLKRQENHMHKTVQHPIRGELTFNREIRNIFRFKKADIPTLDPVYFATKRVGKNFQGILMTEELVNYRSLESWEAEWAKSGWPPLPLRKTILLELAQTIRNMHDHYFRHGSLYPKHLFLKIDSDKHQVDIKIIDLEKARRWPSKFSCALHELTILNRRIHKASAKDKVYFFRYYAKISCLKEDSQKLWEAMKARYLQKVNKH